MGVELQEDLKRKMIDLNLSAALKRKSSETGYIHFNSVSKESKDTIPLLENFCFALALFRSRNTEFLAEGKMLVEKLLVFEVEGNFPIYLHEYPECKDRVFGLEIFPVFHALLQDFTFALGERLASSIEKCKARILSHAYKMDAQRPLSPSASFRLKHFFEPASISSWVPNGPEEWAHGLISCQMSRSSFLFPTALQYWHRGLSLYLGEQSQEAQEPKVTLFDLIMGHYYSQYSKRALKSHPIHLRASLIYPVLARPSEELIPESHWVLSSPQVLHWGSCAQLHSLSIEAKTGLCITRVHAEGLEWQVSLSEPELRDGVELSLFFNTDAFRALYVQGAPSTTFQLGDSLELILKGMRVLIQITLEKGEGRFFGHFLRGNRSCQKEKGAYLAEDWQIALRTLCRSPECQVNLSLTIIPEDSL